MVTIRAYTDLEQSKKLAKILPLESADMYWDDITSAAFNGAPPKIAPTGNGSDWGFPCWSLTSLLGVLPFPVLYMEMVAGMILWCCECHFIETDEMFKIEHYDNPVDACYEMILKLHELKML